MKEKKDEEENKPVEISELKQLEIQLIDFKSRIIYTRERLYKLSDSLDLLDKKPKEEEKTEEILPKNKIDNLTQIVSECNYSLEKMNNIISYLEGLFGDGK